MSAWLASVHASLRVSGGSVRDTAHCMTTTTAALVPLDLEEGIVGYDAILAEIK